MHDGDSPEETWDVFLSFATADQHHAEELKERLEGKGWKVFLAHKSVRHGTQWRKLIPTALGNSRLVAVLLSSQTDQSPYQDGEIIRAIRAKKSGEVELVPIYLDGEPDSLPSWGFGLEGYQSLDLSRLSMREVATRLGDQLEKESSVRLASGAQKPEGLLCGGEDPWRIDLGERQVLLARIGGGVVGVLALLLMSFGWLKPWLGEREAPFRSHESPSVTGQGEPLEEIESSESGKLVEAIATEGQETLGEIGVKEPGSAAVDRWDLPSAEEPDTMEGELSGKSVAVDEEQSHWVRDQEAPKITESQATPTIKNDHLEESEPEMIRIRGGVFEMGDPEDWLNRARPIHTVTVASFEMSKTEITVAQYRACVEEGACEEPQTAVEFCTWGAEGKDDHPINCVSWEEAKVYAKWIGARLPSEAEWEYAARGGGLDQHYPWGDTEVTCDLAVIDDCTSGTQPVCSRIDGNTEQGLCDLAGNVWEWVEDDWHFSYAGAPGDGSAWIDSPRASYRGARGGSWGSPPQFARVVNRDRGEFSHRLDDVGFRIAKSLSSFR